jgi:hypothetical protein
MKLALIYQVIYTGGIGRERYAIQTERREERHTQEERTDNRRHNLPILIIYDVLPPLHRIKAVIPKPLATSSISLDPNSPFRHVLSRNLPLVSTPFSNTHNPIHPSSLFSSHRIAKYDFPLFDFHTSPIFLLDEINHLFRIVEIVYTAIEGWFDEVDGENSLHGGFGVIPCHLHSGYYWEATNKDISPVEY